MRTDDPLPRGSTQHGEDPARDADPPIDLAEEFDDSFEESLRQQQVREGLLEE